MGLNISDDKLVTVDLSHDNYLILNTKTNPSIENLSQLKIISIFRRKQVRGAKNSVGDNCPLIYALKRMLGLKTNFNSIKLLTLQATKILEKIDFSGYDVIIGMPSSFSLVSILTKRIKKRCSHNIISAACLEKISKQAALLQIKSQIPRNEFKKVEIRVSRSQSKYLSLKDIPVKYRKFISPLNACENEIFLLKNKFKTKSNIRFLLVEDLVATGCTLISAEKILLKHFPGSSVDAISLFSRV